MERELLSLLEYQDVLGAVASTQGWSGGGVSSVSRLRCETAAAAGPALVSGAGGDDPALAIDLDGGSLFLTRGSELMLVVLAESSVPQDPLANVMLESVARLDEQIAGAGDSEP